MTSIKRDVRIQAKLDSWAVWRQGSSSPVGIDSCARILDMGAGRRVWGDNDGPPRAYVPVDAIECSIVDDALRALPADLQQAVLAWHGARSGTMEEVARRQGIVKATLHRRLCQADMRIAEWLKARADRRAEAKGISGPKPGQA